MPSASDAAGSCGLVVSGSEPIGQTFCVAVEGVQVGDDPDRLWRFEDRA